MKLEPKNIPLFSEKKFLFAQSRNSHPYTSTKQLSHVFSPIYCTAAVETPEWKTVSK